MSTPRVQPVNFDRKSCEKKRMLNPRNNNNKKTILSPPPPKSLHFRGPKAGISIALCHYPPVQVSYKQKQASNTSGKKETSKNSTKQKANVYHSKHFMINCYQMWYLFLNYSYYNLLTISLFSVRCVCVCVCWTRRTEPGPLQAFLFQSTAYECAHTRTHIQERKGERKREGGRQKEEKRSPWEKPGLGGAVRIQRDASAQRFGPIKFPPMTSSHSSCMNWTIAALTFLTCGHDCPLSSPAKKFSAAACQPAGGYAEHLLDSSLPRKLAWDWRVRYLGYILKSLL